MSQKSTDTETTLNVRFTIKGPAEVLAQRAEEITKGLREIEGVELVFFGLDYNNRKDKSS